MAGGNKIEHELRKAVGIVKEPSEDRQDFLLRLWEKVDVLPEDDWDKLSNAAKDWSNAAGDARNEKKALPEFPDYEEPAMTRNRREDRDDERGTKRSDDRRDKDRADDGDEEDDVKGKTASKKPVAKKAEAKKPEPKKAEAKKPEPKKVEAKKAEAKKLEAKKTETKRAAPVRADVSTEIKKLMLKDMTITTDDLIEALKKKGIKVSKFTAASYRADFRHSVRFLAENDRIKGKIEL